MLDAVGHSFVAKGVVQLGPHHLLLCVGLAQFGLATKDGGESCVGRRAGLGWQTSPLRPRAPWNRVAVAAFLQAFVCTNLRDVRALLVIGSPNCA